MAQIYVASIKKGSMLLEEKIHTMNVEPLISIIVPVYNVIKYMDLCLKSLLNQTYSNIELILVDDGSTDGSAEKCDDYEQKYCNIKVVHKDNGGLSSARNRGIDASNGAFIGFVDSDDWVELDLYEKMISIAQKTNADVVSCLFKRDNVREISGIDNFFSDSNFSIYENEDIIIHYLKSAIRGGYKKNDISCCTKLYRREIIEKSNFIEGIIFEDVIFNACTLSGAHRYVLCNSRGYHYYVNNNSITTKSAYSEKLFDLEKGADIIENYLDAKDHSIKMVVKGYRAKTHVSILAKMMKMENVSRADFEKQLSYVKSNFFINMISSMSLPKKIFLIIVQMIPRSIEYKMLNHLFVKGE